MNDNSIISNNDNFNRYVSTIRPSSNFSSSNSSSSNAHQRSCLVLPGHVYLLPPPDVCNVNNDNNDDNNNFFLQFNDKPELLPVGVDFRKFLPDKETQILVGTELKDTSLILLNKEEGNTARWVFLWFVFFLSILSHEYWANAVYGKKKKKKKMSLLNYALKHDSVYSKHLSQTFYSQKYPPELFPVSVALVLSDFKPRPSQVKVLNLIVTFSCFHSRTYLDSLFFSFSFFLFFSSWLFLLTLAF